MLCPPDMNECEMKNGGCEQNCNNTVGSFNCFCDSGYSLDSNGVNCSGEYNIICKRLFQLLILIFDNFQI